MASNQNRAYAAAHFALELDTKESVGLFRSIEGGGVKADVMTYQNGGNYDRYRQVGKPKFEDIKLQVGMAMSQPFYAWLSDFMKGVPTRKTGAIVAADFYYMERARRNFTAGMIKELTFPKLDGADKNAAYMTVSISVEDIEFVKGNGHKLAAPEGFDNQKIWTSCNFSFSLDGFEPACQRVTKVDSFTIKQNVAEYHAGGAKAPIKTPTAIEYPNVTFYVPEADAQPFMDAMQVSVGFGGKEGEQPKHKGTVRHAVEKKNGQLETFDNAGKRLFYVEFYGADIVSVTPDKSDASSEEIKLVKIELFTEKMTFNYG